MIVSDRLRELIGLYKRKGTENRIKNARGDLMAVKVDRKYLREQAEGLMHRKSPEEKRELWAWLEREVPGISQVQMLLFEDRL